MSEQDNNKSKLVLSQRLIGVAHNMLFYIEFVV